MHRLYAETLDGEQVRLARDEADHARKSLRLGAGDVVELFDGCGGLARGTVVSTGPEMVVQVIEWLSTRPLQPVVEIASAVPKGNRADTLVEKLAELGVACWRPLMTERSVVDPRPGKLERFERIALAAAKQCGRAHRMWIEPPMALDKLIAQADHEHKAIADLAPSPVQNLHEANEPPFSPPTIKEESRRLVLIGPEGGWTDAERAQCERTGYVTWRFGPHVMRIETAAIAAAAILLQHATEQPT